MKPLAVRAGSVRAAVYSVPVGNRKRWEVRWSFSGKIYRVKTKSRQAALLLAQEKVAQIATGQSAKSRITDAQAYEAERAAGVLAPFGMSLLQVAYEYAERRRVAEVGESKATVPELVARYLTAKGAQGLSPYHCRDLQLRLSRFAADFQVPVSRVSAERVGQWLDGLGLKTPRTWNNYRAAVAALFAWAADGGEVKADLLKKVHPRKCKKEQPEIFTPAQMRLLLEGAARNMIPPLALGAFAGVRSEEIARLKWSDFKWEGGYILLREHVTKTARARQVPILPNLKAWLSPWHAASGPVSRYKNPRSLAASKASLALRLGLTWKGNALRKSFISYRVADTGNVAAVALEVGNSAGMIHAHYLDLVTPAAAAEWFAIRPQNVQSGLLRLEFR